MREVTETNNTSTPVVLTVSPLPTGCTWDAFEDDDFPSQAKPITVDSAQARNFCDDTVDLASFTATTDGTYLVTVSAAATGVGFLAADGTTTVPAHATYSTRQASLVATGGQTYYIKTTTYTAGAGADYSLLVNQCTLDAYEEDDTQALAQPISVGQTQDRNKCDDGEDWASFTATAGTSYTITTTDVGAEASANLMLYSATGFIQSGLTKGSKRVINWTAPTSGTYYIRVTESWGWGLNREYTLNLN